MKNQTVILTALLGVIFTQRKNADGSPKLDKKGNPFGYIRVENPSTVDLQYSYENGGVRKGQSALINMTVAGWEKAKSAYKEGMEIKGNVVVIETTDSELAKSRGYQAKMAGSKENAIPCTIGGAQIYRGTEFDASCTKEDVLIAHDNGAAISALAKVSTEALNA